MDFEEFVRAVVAEIRSSNKKLTVQDPIIIEPFADFNMGDLKGRLSRIGANQVRANLWFESPKETPADSVIVGRFFATRRRGL
jgi:hypothetical protein